MSDANANVSERGNTQPRYGATSIALHWLMALLLVAAYATMELEEAFPGGEDALEAWHYALGLAVLVLVAVRIVVRLVGSAPPINPQPAAWQRVLTKLVHLGLYLFMVSMPVLGWMTLSGEGEPATLPLLGWPIVPIPGVDQALGETAEELHEAIAVIGYWLVGLHTLAALAHHYLFHDDTLRRMWPLRSSA